MNSGKAISPAIHLVFIVAALCLWEFCANRGLLNPTFFGRPSGTVTFLWKGFVLDGKLWINLGYTLQRQLYRS